MNNDIAEVIADIEKVACLINMQGKHNVFIYNQGHVNEIQIRAHLNGWKNNRDPFLSEDISYDINYKYFEYEKSLKVLKRVRDTLKKLYKNGIVEGI